jgi:hypothetical protein
MIRSEGRARTLNPKLSLSQSLSLSTSYHQLFSSSTEQQAVVFKCFLELWRYKNGQMDILASTLGNVDVVCIVKRRWEGAEKGKKKRQTSFLCSGSCLLAVIVFGVWTLVASNLVFCPSPPLTPYLTKSRLWGHKQKETTLFMRCSSPLFFLLSFFFVKLSLNFFPFVGLACVLTPPAVVALARRLLATP